MEFHRTPEPLPQRKHRTFGIRNAKITLMLMLPCASILVLSCWFSGYNYSSRAEATQVVQTAGLQPPAGVASPSQPAVPADAITMACNLIAKGQFDQAAQRVAQIQPADGPRVRDVKGIVDQYEQISQQRQSTKETAFKKQQDELTKLRSKADLEKLPRLSRADTDSELGSGLLKRDPNEPNDVTDVLAVVARAAEFADATQKAALLSDPFVARVMEKAVDHSAALETQGRWLDAYASYFYWLSAIDPNNKGYFTHAEELLDMASIAASFQDSPCETCSERYDGVEKYMFDRAIDALNLHYVKGIDYPEMAARSIKRCKLLAEVLSIAYAEGSELAKEGSFHAPEPNKVTAWSVALTALQEEVDASVKAAKEAAIQAQRASSGEAKPPAETFGKDEFLTILDKVVSLNEATVQLPTRPLVAHFVEAALGTLDPYTVVVWPRQVQDFEKLMTNEFTGIGIEISKPKGMLTVSSLLPDTPAYRSGLDAGDVIESVDGIPTKDMSLVCAVKKITGPKGSKVALAIRRSGEQEARNVEITRDRIIVPTIRGWQRAESGKWLYMLDDTEKIGYVRITSFSSETADDLEAVLKELEAQGLRGLIMDLRFNTGGLLNSAVSVVDKFISEGLIVRTQPKANMIPEFEYAHRKGTHPDYPLVILINSGSASASEIVAGALADVKYQRAVLVGTRTHGKGSVQGITHYPGGGAELKYTMAYYHLPSGQRVKSREEVEKEGNKDWGVGPDVKVELTSEETKTMIDVQRDNDVLVQADRNEGRRVVKKVDVQQALKADPQLAVGLLVVKAKLVSSSSPGPNMVAAK